jgi:hypothetical protein
VLLALLNSQHECLCNIFNQIQVVEQCGGFRQFGAYLAEDYFLGQAFAKAYANQIYHIFIYQLNCHIFQRLSECYLAYAGPSKFLKHFHSNISRPNLPVGTTNKNASFIFIPILFSWIKLRIAMLPHTIILEPAQECVVASIIGALSITHFFGIQALPLFLAFHYIYWAICDYILIHIFQVSNISIQSPHLFINCNFRTDRCPSVFPNSYFVGFSVNF